MTHHLTNGMDEILTVQIVESILIRIVSVGLPVEVISRGVLHSVFVMGILRKLSVHVKRQRQGTYAVFLFIEHEGGNGTTLVSVVPSLSMNADGSMANAEMVDSARDGTERGRH